MKSKETTTQTQEEFHATVVEKIRNDSVLKESLNYLDNYNVVLGIKAVEECYSTWLSSAKSLDKQKTEEMDQKIFPLLIFLIELAKADVKIVDMAIARFNKLIEQKKEQQK